MPKRDSVLAALGRNVRSQRDAKTFTQEKLAERSGLDPTYISGIERGLRNLFFEIVNILKFHQPGAIVLENVKNLTPARESQDPSSS